MAIRIVLPGLSSTNSRSIPANYETPLNAHFPKLHAQWPEDSNYAETGRCHQYMVDDFDFSSF
jgi:hypothetical protein